MFGSFARYKREAYRHSAYAPRILYDEGIDVIMKVRYQTRIPPYSHHQNRVIPLLLLHPVGYCMRHSKPITMVFQQALPLHLLRQRLQN